MICKELGWSLDYVEHGISYAKLLMMLVDLPHHIKTEQNNKSNKMELTEDNAEDVLQMMLGHGARLKE